MKNTRKGFTLVELVIVIAVIAILAGVLIFTFASVTKRASEAAKIQEMKSAEIAQKAEDILAKIDNADWFGWEDFEASIVDKITTVITSTSGSDVDVQDAVEKGVAQAMAKYYAEHTMANTGLTEEQVKAIVENAFGSFKYEGVSVEQVSAIVNNAIAKIQVPLSITQVQRIVEAAVTRVEVGQLSTTQITTIVTNALATCKDGLATEATVNAAVEDVVDEITKAKAQQLTAEQVERIITAAVGAAGSTTWVNSQSYANTGEFELKDADEVKGLATLVNGGYDFDDKVIELPATVDLSTSGDWTPIGNSYETQFKGTLVGAELGTVIDGLTLTSEFNAVRNGLLIDCSSTNNMDKVGVGFVAYLGEGAVLENITFTNVKINITDDKMDGIYIGTAVGYLDGGVIRNVKVTSGYVKGVYRVGGLVGAASYGLIDNCEIGADVVVQSTGLPGTGNIAAGKGATYNGYFSAGGLVGLFRNFAIKNSTTIVNINNTFVNTTNISSAVDSNASYKLGQTDSDTTSVKIYGTGVTVNAYLGNGTIPESYLRNSNTITAATMPLE